MKYLIISTLFITFPQAGNISSMDHQSIHTYNNRPTMKNRGEKNAHKLHKIDEKRAVEIARKKCGRSDIKLKLAHSRLYLYYIATSKGCRVYIDAVNGKLIDIDDIKKGGGR